MSFKTIKTKEENKIIILTISRPEALNALNSELLLELENFIKELDFKKTRAVIITGEGKAFVAGADIHAFKNMNESQAYDLAKKGQNLFSLIEKSKVPFIAAINGFALGGGLELALSCDILLASKNAKIGLPEVSLGLIPGYGGTQRLSRCVGRSLAKAISMCGEIFSSESFSTWGLMAEVVDSDKLMERALWWAEKISSKSPLAIANVKKVVQEGFDSEFERGLELEAKCFAKCFNTLDQKEGVDAFLTKRRPEFKGE